MSIDKTKVYTSQVPNASNIFQLGPFFYSYYLFYLLFLTNDVVLLHKPGNQTENINLIWHMGSIERHLKCWRPNCKNIFKLIYANGWRAPNLDSSFPPSRDFDDDQRWLRKNKRMISPNKENLWSIMWSFYHELGWLVGWWSIVFLL